MKAYRFLRSDRRGFSLIELIVVLLVLSILTATAVPSMTAYTDRNRTRRALDRVSGDISFARMTALERGNPTRVVFQADGVYVIQTFTPPGSWNTLRTVSLGLELPGVAFTAGASNLQFSSRGLLTNLSTEGYVRISRGSVRDSLFVSPAGRVYRDF
jgi:type IV fimbrial biogenesis protein FimU